MFRVSLSRSPFLRPFGEPGLLVSSCSVFLQRPACPLAPLVLNLNIYTVCAMTCCQRIRSWQALMAEAFAMLPCKACAPATLQVDRIFMKQHVGFCSCSAMTLLSTQLTHRRACDHDSSCTASSYSLRGAQRKLKPFTLKQFLSSNSNKVMLIETHADLS